MPLRRDSQKSRAVRILGQLPPVSDKIAKLEASFPQGRKNKGVLTFILISLLLLLGLWGYASLFFTRMNEPKKVSELRTITGHLESYEIWKGYRGARLYRIQFREDSRTYFVSTELFETAHPERFTVWFQAGDSLTMRYVEKTGEIYDLRSDRVTILDFAEALDKKKSTFLARAFLFPFVIAFLFLMWSLSLKFVLLNPPS